MFMMSIWICLTITLTYFQVLHFWPLSYEELNLKTKKSVSELMEETNAEATSFLTNLKINFTNIQLAHNLLGRVFELTCQVLYFCRLR